MQLIKIAKRTRKESRLDESASYGSAHWLSAARSTGITHEGRPEHGRPITTVRIHFQADDEISRYRVDMNPADAIHLRDNLLRWFPVDNIPFSESVEERAARVEAYESEMEHMAATTRVAQENRNAAASVDAFAKLAKPGAAYDPSKLDSTIREELGYCFAVVNNGGGVNVPESAVESYLHCQAAKLGANASEVYAAHKLNISRDAIAQYDDWAKARRIMGELADWAGAADCDDWAKGVGEFHSQQRPL